MECAGKVFDVVQEFDEFTGGLMGFGMVYNERDRTLLFMGGYKKAGRDRIDDIWLFSMDKRWEKLENVKMPYKMQSFACVITSDCKNILVFGGSVPDGFSQKIQILNLETMKWRVSKIEIPYKTIKDGSVILMRKG